MAHLGGGCSEPLHSQIQEGSSEWPGSLTGSPTEPGSHGERSFPKSLPATHRRKGGGCWARKSQRPDTGRSLPQGKQGWHSLAGIWFPQAGSNNGEKFQRLPQSWLWFRKMAATLSPGAIDPSGDGSSQHWGAALKTWSLARVCLLWLQGSQGPMLRLPGAGPGSYLSSSLHLALILSGPWGLGSPSRTGLSSCFPWLGSK